MSRPDIDPMMLYAILAQDMAMMGGDGSNKKSRLTKRGQIQRAREVALTIAMAQRNRELLQDLTRKPRELADSSPSESDEDDEEALARRFVLDGPESEDDEGGGSYEITNGDLKDYEKKKKKRERGKDSVFGPALDQGLDGLDDAMLKERCARNGIQLTDKESTSRIEMVLKLKAQGIDPFALDQQFAASLNGFFGKKVTIDYIYFQRVFASSPMDYEDDSDEDGFFADFAPLEDLRDIASQIYAPFYLNQTIGMPESLSFTLNGKRRTIKNFPIRKHTAMRLQHAGTKTPVGHGTKTVYSSERKSKHLTPDQFTINDPKWNEQFTTSNKSKLLEHIRLALAPNTTQITAQLYKLLIYGKHDYFVNHKDTQRDPNMFGTIVVDLPSWHLEGDLYVNPPPSHKKSDGYYMGEKMPSYNSWLGTCPVTAFYADSEHQVNSVAAGFRVSLVYNLLRTGKPIDLSNLPAKFVCAVDKFFKQATTTHPEKGKKKFYLGHLLDHQYGAVSMFPDKLKGNDALIYQALLQSNKYDLLLTPVHISVKGQGGCGEETDPEEAEHLLDHENIRTKIHPIDVTLPPGGYKKHHSFALATTESLQSLGVVFIEDEADDYMQRIASDVNPTGNEGTGVMLLYLHAALLIKEKDPAAAGAAAKASATAAKPK